MAPAIECKCGFRIKTAEEPATQDQVKSLLGTVCDHMAIAIYEQPSPVKVEFKWYAKTPTDGRFDQAIVVKEPQNKKSKNYGKSLC